MESPGSSGAFCLWSRSAQTLSCRAASFETPTVGRPTPTWTPWTRRRTRSRSPKTSPCSMAGTARSPESPSPHSVTYRWYYKIEKQPNHTVRVQHYNPSGIITGTTIVAFKDGIVNSLADINQWGETVEVRRYKSKGNNEFIVTYEIYLKVQTTFCLVNIAFINIRMGY